MIRQNTYHSDWIKFKYLDKYKIKVFNFKYESLMNDPKPLIKGEDTCNVDAVTEGLLPLLRL